ncbi:hypothetical protein DFH06DRAFT_1227501, partial [Mycena polygramma]
MSKLYVGNLSWNTTDDVLRDAFSQHGEVVDCIMRGFGFVTFASDDQAQKAIDSMNEQDLDDRRIRVNVAGERGGGGGGGSYGQWRRRWWLRRRRRWLRRCNGSGFSNSSSGDGSLW